MRSPTKRDPRAGRGGNTRHQGRPVYTDEQKRIVREQYHLCNTRADKVSLQQRLGLASLEQLYNLANRLGVTRAQRERVAIEEEPPAIEPAFDPARLRMREDPETTRFTKEGDSYLRRHFGESARTRRHIEEIAFHLGHTESAVLYRARHLGIRRFCKYWRADKVEAWLACSREDLTAMGVDFYECLDPDGNTAITLVSSSSLVRLIGSEMAPDQPEGEDAPSAGDELHTDHTADLERSGADAFFLRELAEMRSAVAAGGDVWERSRWVSHGHTCLNPFAGLSFGLFDDGRDHKVPGRSLHPADLSSRVLVGV